MRLRRLESLALPRARELLRLLSPLELLPLSLQELPLELLSLSLPERPL